jgi:hypothetical protein
MTLLRRTPKDVFSPDPYGNVGLYWRYSPSQEPVHAWKIGPGSLSVFVLTICAGGHILQKHESMSGHELTRRIPRPAVAV